MSNSFAIIVPFKDRSWVGGINYFKGLLRAVDLCGNGSEIVLYFYRNTPADIKAEFGGYKSKIFNFDAPVNIFGRAVGEAKSILNLEGRVEEVLKKDGVRLLSHSGWLRKKSEIKTLGWLADCQHAALPHLFSKKEIISRDRGFKKTVERCTATVFSSKSSAIEAANFLNMNDSNIEVLHFSKESNFLPSEFYAKKQETLNKYNSNKPFFLLPNQFWAHKNHALVIEAISALKNNAKLDFEVLCTGSTSDRRDPNFFSCLKVKWEEMNVSDNFKSLGLIPYSDLQILMQASIGVINPSLYEGWSSSVEEAKSLGKCVIASSIPVHLEQKPSRGVYFDPCDSEDLANKLIYVFNKYNKDDEIEYMIQAKEESFKSMIQFGENYIGILKKYAS